MKVIAVSALLAMTSAIQYDGYGYTTGVPHDQIGSRWGLKPTKTWIPGPRGGVIYHPDSKNPAQDFADAVARQEKQERSFAVDSIHQNGDLAQVESMGVWGKEPTQTWIPGPGGDKDQQEAEARNKRDYLSRSVDSVVPNVVAQMKHQTTDDLVE